MSSQAYESGGYGIVKIAIPPILSPRDPVDNVDIAAPQGSLYTVGQIWKNTSNSNVWELMGTRNWQLINTATGAGILSITANTGTAVGPSVTGNVNLIGNNQAIFAGNPITDTITLTQTSAGYPITPYVVGPIGYAGYQTIQSAINAANTAGGGVIYIQPGAYTENLTLFDKIDLYATPAVSQNQGASVSITGTHTPPASGHVGFNSIVFISTTNAFLSNAAGTTHLAFLNCESAIQNGYFLNLPNWTGTLEIFDFNGQTAGAPFAINDGAINNSGGALVLLYDVGIGNGTGHTAIISGLLFADGSQLSCPINYITGANINWDGCQFTQTQTLSNNTTGYFDTCHFITGGTVPITMSSSGAVSITNSTISTSHNPAIAGSGSGTLTLGGITFNGNTAIAGTLTTIGSGGFMPGSFGTSTQVFISNGPGVIPSFQNNPSVTTVNVQTFTSSGTYTPTAGLNYATIEVQGGGGGSGGADATGAGQLAGGAGGGGGGYARKTVSAATIGASQTVTVGAGGTAGAAGANAGGTGGTSSVGTIVSATGGGGGGGGATFTSGFFIVGASGGNGSSGDVNVTGGNGGASVGVTGDYASGGPGGSSFFGGTNANVIANNPGIIGNLYGGGASGACGAGGAAAQAGASGAAGIVIITEYI